MGRGDAESRRAGRVVAVATAKRASRPAVLWGILFGGTIATTMPTYVSAFPTRAARSALAATFEGNVAFEAIFGVIRRMDTVAGYTAYKSTFFIVILGAIWGLLIATRVLRGEEDSGRWEMYLSGQNTRRRAAGRAATGLAAGLVAMWVPTAILAVAGGSASTVGIAAGTCLFFVTACISSVAMFMAVGMLTSQIAATRHDANLIGAGVLAAAYLLRMVADSSPSLGWLRWVSPIGWIEELRPLTGSRPLAFLPIAALVVGCVAGSISIASRRDLGASALRSRDVVKSRTLLLGGQAGLTVRLTRATVLSWLVAMTTVGLVFGLVTQAAAKGLKGSPTFERVIERLGADAAGGAVYLGFVFIIAAGLVAIAVAGQIAAIRTEEASGHLDNLLVRRVTRWRWLTVRSGMGLLLVVAASLFAGVAAWLGAASQGAGLPFVELLKAGLNVAPPAVFVLGIGILAFGLVPRASVAVTYGLVVWSFFVEVIASVFDSNRWLLDTSPLLHITPAPATAPNWTAAAWLVGLGLLAVLVGTVSFTRRDVVAA